MGSQLVQGGVLCAAACDVELIPVLAGEGFQLPECFPVAVRQRMIDTVDKVGIRGRGFAGLGKGGSDLRAHVLRGREPGCVHIKNAGVGAGLGQLHHLGKGDAQLFLHTLDDPQTHDVFQVADVAHAALVGKVCAAAFRVGDGLCQLDPSRLHVPEDKNGASPCSMGMPSTALAVSWVAHSTTLVCPPTSAAMSAFNGPSTVPGAVSLGGTLPPASPKL